MSRPMLPIVHGEYRGYQKCRLRREGACEPCKAAHRAYQADLRARRTDDQIARERAYGAARFRALTRLAGVHSDLYYRLLAEELRRTEAA